MTDDRTNADPAATVAMPTSAHQATGGRRELVQAETSSGSGQLEVRCPNCHAPMEVAVDTSLTDLTCDSCGSHFSLVDQSQATRMAPPLSKLGRFELVERLGIGGFGSVWKARDKELDRTVAIKIPRAGAMTAEEQEKFFREARAAAQLRHPNIVSVHEVGRDGDSVYIVSDFVRGVTLGDWLSGQQLTSREAAELCAKIAEALHHAHEQSVVHRDLKPANIMIDGDGQPHLMDFGLARREVGEVTVTMEGQVLGTPAYMSPEQAQGEAHTADRRSDVYSLGVILFQLLTGELPFRGNARMLMHQVIHDEPPSPRKLNANIAKDLETITLKCLDKDPAKRYQTSRELAEELRRFLSGEPILARPIGGLHRVWRWSQRRPAVASLSAAVAGLLLLVAIAGPVAAFRQASLRREAEANELKAVQLKATAERSQQAAERLAENEALQRKAAEDAQVRLAIATENAQEHARRADIERQAAQTAQQALAEEKRRADRTLYARTISLAFQEWQADNVTRCADLLDSTQPEYRDWEWHYVKQLCHSDLITLLGPISVPYHTRFHKDGTHIVSASRNEFAVFVWDATTGALVNRHKLNGYAVSGDGTIVAGIAEGDSMRRVTIIDALSGQVSRRIDAHPGGAGFMVLDFTGSTLVTTGGDQTVKIWETASGKLLKEVDDPAPVHPVAISPDGSRLAWKAFGKSSNEGSLVVHDARTGEQLWREFVPIYRDLTNRVAFSADGKLIATAPTDQIHIRDAGTGERLISLHGHRGLVFGLAFDESSLRLASAGYDGTVRIWDVRSGRELLRLRGHKPGSEYGVVTVAFDSDGTRLASGGFDRTVKVWDTSATAAAADAAAGGGNGKNRTEADLANYQLDPRQDLDWLMGHSSSVMDADFTPDGQCVVTASADFTLKVFDLRQKSIIRELNGHGESINAVAVSPDGSLIASGSGAGYVGSNPGTIILWSRETGELRQKLTGHTAPIQRICFLPGGDRLVSISGSLAVPTGEMIIWDVSTGQPLHRVVGKRAYFGLSITSDGKTIATCGDGTIRLWNAQTAEHIRDLGNEDYLCVAFSPDGRHIAAGSNAWAITVLDVESGKPIWRRVDHTGAVTDVSFTPNGNRLISSSVDGSARLWDAASGDNLLTLRGHAADLFGARMDPGGAALVCFGREPYLSLRTIPQAAADDDPEWPIIFADSFDRDELGDDWQTISGQWSIENGAARGALSTVLPNVAVASMCTKPFAPATAEVAFDAWAPIGLICESIFYDEAMRNAVTSVYIGVAGTPFNHGEKGTSIAIQAEGGTPIFLSGKRTGFTFEPNQKYRFRTVRNRNEWKMYVDDELVLESEIPETFVMPVFLLQASLGPPGSALFVDNLEVRAPPSASDESTAIRLEYDLNQRLKRKSLVLDVIQNDTSITEEVRALAIRMAELRDDEANRKTAFNRLLAFSRLSPEGTAMAVKAVEEISLDEPLDAFQQLVVGELFILGERPDKAIPFISKAIENGGTQPYYQKSYGWALWRANRRDEAAEAFEKALGQTRLEDADLNQCVAAYFLDRMSQDDFVQRAAADRGATEGFAWFYIGQRYEAEGSSSDAVKAYEKAAEAAKQPNLDHANGVWAAYRLAKLKEAQGPPISAD